MFQVSDEYLPRTKSELRLGALPRSDGFEVCFSELYHAARQTGFILRLAPGVCDRVARVSLRVTGVPVNQRDMKAGTKCSPCPHYKRDPPLTFDDKADGSVTLKSISGAMSMEGLHQDVGTWSLASDEKVCSFPLCVVTRAPAPLTRTHTPRKSTFHQKNAGSTFRTPFQSTRIVLFTLHLG